MKKIMMLLGVALAAALSHAATVNWSASNLAADYKGQTFYLFDASKSSDVLTALGAVDASTATTLESMAIYKGATTTKGKATANALDVGNTTSMMALVIAGDIADGTSYMTITEDISGMVYTPPAAPPGTFASALATSGTAGTMSSGGGGDVPEPTSGLLLLVGGAMLALRRKQK